MAVISAAVYKTVTADGYIVLKMHPVISHKTMRTGSRRSISLNQSLFAKDDNSTMTTITI